MTISVWRYSHLALAVSSFIFIALASITGAILSFEPVSEKASSYKADQFSTITLAEAIPVLSRNITEISDVSVDANQFVVVKGIDSTDENITAYVHPTTGKILGVYKKKSEFYQWITDLHRSLFLHEAGRFFVGLTSFLLLLIAVSGSILIIQRQRGLKRFFTKIVKENFAQYYHVVLGRLTLIPIIIISLTGTWLSLERFNIIPEKKVTHKIDFENIKSEPLIKTSDFAVFRNVVLSDVQSIEYPFSNDPEDYYTLKLKDREIVVNQFTGDILSEVKYPVSTLVSNLSLDFHTGRTNIIWAIILGIASLNILFFIYSGFVITLKRTKSKIKNKYKADECRFIILAGSENGSTMRYASAVHKQLLAAGQLSYLAQPNNYKAYAKAEHLVIITATYGLGNPPSNANRFISLLQKHPQQRPVHFSVLGFGSHAYPDFCRFAYDVNNVLSKQSWAIPFTEIHTVNDRAPEQFGLWLETWSQKLDLPGITLSDLHKKPTGFQAMSVIQKTALDAADGAFLIRFKTRRWATYNSGDLLAVHPANDHRERLYSIGKIKNEIQLSVRLHPGGLGSKFLYNLAPGSILKARIISNAHFQFPQKAPVVIMISNGTGIAPFLGMIDQNNKKTECHLYCGFRGQSSFDLYQQSLDDNKQLNKVSSIKVAYSREHKKQYVKDLLVHDAELIARTLGNKGVLMLCGSLSMQRDVIELLEIICQEKTGNSISFYQSHGQVLMDCY